MTGLFTMETPDAALRTYLGRMADLNAAAATLEWDQETYMPAGGHAARAQQLSTLRAMAHDLLTDDALMGLLEKAASADDPRTADLVAVTQRDVEKARRIPTALVQQMARASAEAKEAWREARETDTFATFAPHLQRLLDLNRQKAEALCYADEPYDALLDTYEPGMTTATVADVFTSLRAALVPTVEAIADEPTPDDTFLHQSLDEDTQVAFGRMVVNDLGYDFSRGRLDLSTHPFSTAFSIGDVRLTTRVAADFFPTSFFGTVHEAGHGMYEQGIDAALDRTPLAEGTSLGMHESQSRLWENHVGRSHAFWSHYYPALQQHFPDALGAVDRTDFYRAINKVEPSFIRVEADEVTYPLHVMLRFELERALLNERLAVADLPDAWNAGMEDYLGCCPPSDRQGVLQDIHWALGAIGYFPTYALGTLMAAQLFQQIERDLPEITAHIASGNFVPLLKWLRTHIHRWGRRRTAQALLRGATGTELDPAPFLRYIHTKYGALYQGVPASASSPSEA